MSKYVVTVTDCRHSSYEIEKRILESIDAELQLRNCQTEEELIEACAESDAILLDSAPMTKKVISSLHKCKIINRYGVGFDNLDVEACTNQGIWASNVPDYCADDVSEHAIALLFACMRQIAFKDRSIRAGKWNIFHDKIYRLAGKNLGVIGGGRIGRALIKKVQGLGFSTIFVYDPFKTEEEIAEWNCKKVSLEELLANSDFVSLHLPLSLDTKWLINSANIGLMKANAILVNTSRGSLIEPEALIQALEIKKILCAGLDTHSEEPLAIDSPFLKLDNVVLTDHCAYNSVEATNELKSKSALNVAAVLTGQAPGYPLNHISN